MSINERPRLLFAQCDFLGSAEEGQKISNSGSIQETHSSSLSASILDDELLHVLHFLHQNCLYRKGEFHQKSRYEAKRNDRLPTISDGNEVDHALTGRDGDDVRDDRVHVCRNIWMFAEICSFQRRPTNLYGRSHQYPFVSRPFASKRKYLFPFPADERGRKSRVSVSLVLAKIALAKSRFGTVREWQFFPSADHNRALLAPGVRYRPAQRILGRREENDG